VTPPHVVRVLASVRVPSGHGPDVDYEIVHAIVSSGPDARVTHESVLLRLAVGPSAKNDRAAEVLVQDLPAVSAQWTRFVTDVLWRRAQAGDADAQAALEKLQKQAAPPPMYGVPAAAAPAPIVISASGGRFGPKGANPDAAPIISMGSKKASAPASPPPAAAEEARRPVVPDQYQVIGFNLSAPPTADGLMRPIQAHPDQLIIVAPMAVARKAEDFVRELKAGSAKGRPTTFAPIVIRRRDGGPVPHKKLRAELAGGIARMLGDPNSALWILPE
jgi:hypothetical protein